MGLNPLLWKLVTVMMGVGQTSFTAAHVSHTVVMDSLVNILIPTHTWPSTNTAVEDLSNLCAREPHTPPKATDGASKNHGPWTGSIIDFIPKLLLRMYYAVHTNGMTFFRQADRVVKLASDYHIFVEGMEVREAKVGSFVWRLVYVHTCTQTHAGEYSHSKLRKEKKKNAPTHFASATTVWMCSQKAHQWNFRFSQLRVFLCNQASNEWNGKPLSCCDKTVSGTQQRYKH